MNSDEFLKLVYDLEQVREVLEEKVKAHEEEQEQPIRN